MAVGFVARAPAKLILFGEHAVVYGYPALATAINVYTTGRLVEAGLSVDEPMCVLQLTLPDEGSVALPIRLSHINALGHEAATFTGAQETLQQFTNEIIVCAGLDGHKHCYAPLCLRMFLQILAYIYFEKRKLKDFSKSINVEILTEAPVGAGLGASASYSVVVSALLLAYADHIVAECYGGDNTEKPLSHAKNSTNDADEHLEKVAFDLGEINECAFVSEQVAHGQPSGVDNFIATYGGMHVFTVLPPGNDCLKTTNTFQCNQVVADCTHACRLLVVDTREPKSTRDMVNKVRQFHETSPAECTALFQTITKQLKSVLPLLGWHDENDEADERNLTTTPERLLQNEEDNHYFRRLSDCVATCHECLQKLGVSTKALDQIVEMANKFGFPAKLTGAGGGGCAFILLPTEQTLSDSTLNMAPPAQRLEERVSVLKDELVRLGFKCTECKMESQGVYIRKKR